MSAQQTSQKPKSEKIGLYIDMAGTYRHLEHTYKTPKGQRLLHELMDPPREALEGPFGHLITDTRPLFIMYVLLSFPLDHPTSLVEQEVRRVRDSFDGKVVAERSLRPWCASWVCARPFC